MHTTAKLAEIGRDMIASDNRLTAAPVWVYKKTLRFFITEKAAKEYCEAKGLDPDSEIYVASANDNTHILSLMAVCIQEAGLSNHPVAHNAYYKAVKIIKGG